MKALMEEAIKDLNAQYIEVRIEDTFSTDIVYRGKYLDVLSENHNYGGCVRALVNGGWGFVSFNNIDNLKSAAQTAVHIASLVANERKEKTSLAPIIQVNDVVKANLINDPRNHSLEEKKEILEKYNKIILSSSNEITSSSIRYSDNYTKLYFLNSDGSYIEQEKVDIGGNISAIAVRGSETETSHLGFGSSNDFGCVLNKEAEVENICKTVISLLNAKTVTGGSYTVIVDPILAGVFIHEAFGHLSEADSIYEDENLKKVMILGRRFGRDILNVFDSGLIEGKRGYLKYDDEGTNTEKTYLIKNGLLTGRLHSRESAYRMDEKPTGNARAVNYKFPPICRMRTTCIENGESSFEELISGIKLGVYAKKAYGGQTNGEMFTFGAGEGYMIRDGKLAELVKNVNLSGNVFDTLSNISMIGNDFSIVDSGGGCGKGGQMPLPVSHGSPHIKIENVVIGGK